jgi:hypothetical protein
MGGAATPLPSSVTTCAYRLNATLDETGAVVTMTNKTVQAIAAAPSDFCDVKIKLPNGADLRNITGFIKNLDTDDQSKLDFSMHDRWVFVHPAVLALTACAAELVHSSGGTFGGSVPNIRSLTYLIRMKLFDYVRLPPPIEIVEHEEAGRFIPLTQIKTAEDLRHAIANLVPLLHAEKEVADPIKYVFSEMVSGTVFHEEHRIIFQKYVPFI